jgi:hypothetical protein
MPVFKVLRRVDAFVDYVAEIEAENPEEAAELAAGEEDSLKWRKEGTYQFDSRLFVTLDENGVTIDATSFGDVGLLPAAPRGGVRAA